MRFALSFLIVFTTLSLNAQGPYAAAANTNGTTAIHKDSSILVGWAKSCTIARGYLDIANPSKGYATVGDSSSALGKALSNGVVSLGDGGTATLTFDATLYNGPGYDFAVFENGFTAVGGGDYLELAFVEVSSDGQKFFRFPAHSLTDTAQSFGSFGILDPTEINNLAGKYYLGYGTPFDLEEMKGIQGLDVDAISHLRIVDVVGTKNSAYAAYDTASRVILDPYPTAFPSGGFDLDAVAAIHMNPLGIKEKQTLKAHVFPNPFRDRLIVQHRESCKISYQLLSTSAKKLKQGFLEAAKATLDFSSLSEGVYFLRLNSASAVRTIKVLKQ
ncbi:MAG: T9SS type A sorting domain-containing protein [Vicingaceae bacterium]